MPTENIEMNNLRDLAFQIGINSNFVQGPAGNISYKKQSIGKAWVKKSGANLADALNQNIFMEMSLDIDLDQEISFTDESPSIEFYFHLYFSSTWVVHVHSVNAVTLAIRNDLPELLSNMGDEGFLVIDYAKPGYEIYKLIKSKIQRENTKTILLKNHGIIFFGNSACEVLNKLIKFESNFNNLFPEQIDLRREILNVGVSQYLNNGFLTPDHAVFYHSRNKSLKLKNISDQIEEALVKSLSKIPNLNLINCLNSKDVMDLLDWDLEKNRVKENK